jgi:hypothetical protein
LSIRLLRLLVQLALILQHQSQVWCARARQFGWMILTYRQY